MRAGRKQLVYEVVRRTRRGESKRGIARALGIAPRTMTGILAAEDARRSEGETALERELPARRAPRASKLDAYAERIDAWLEQYPDLTATRLHEKLVEVGFAGRYTIVRQHLKALRGRQRRGEHVFPAETGGPLSTWGAADRLLEATRRAALRRIGWHVLRHSFASQLVAAGVLLLAIQGLLGHSTVQMTMRYAHLAPATLKAAVDQLLLAERTSSGHPVGTRSGRLPVEHSTGAARSPLGLEQKDALLAQGAFGTP